MFHYSNILRNYDDKEKVTEINTLKQGFLYSNSSMLSKTKNNELNTTNITKSSHEKNKKRN